MVSHNLQQRGAAEAVDEKFAVEQRMGAAVMLLQEVRNWPGGQGVLCLAMNFIQTLIWTLLLPYRGVIHSNANGASSRWREAVTEWMHSLRLQSLCTFDHCLALPHRECDHVSCWTHRNSNKGGLFQLDYMLVSEHVHGEACVVRGGYHLNSDHWPIDGSLRLERRELWGTVNHDEFSQRGWVPKTDEAKQFFMRGVAKDLCWMNE